MAHFAQLNDNTVVQVIVVHDNDCLIDGVEAESAGVAFCQSLFGSETNWKQTSYNRNIRKNFAGVGYTYDNQRDAFIPPKPFASWTLNEDTCQWAAPEPIPMDGKMYRWEEASQTWISTE